MLDARHAAVDELRRIAVAALESSGTAMAITDAEVRLTHVNPAFLRLWGYARAADVLGRPATELWADRAAGGEATRAISSDGEWAGELLARRADGSDANVRVSA